MAFNMNLNPLSLEVVHRHHALSELVLTPFAARGFVWLRGRMPERRRFVRVAAAATLVAVTAASAYQIRAHHTDAIEQFLDETLASVPDDAIIVGTGDHRYLGINYLQRCRDAFGSVDYVDAKLLGYDWYRDEVDRKLGIEAPSPIESPDGGRPIYPIVEFVRRAQKTGRPVFAMDDFTPKLSAAFPNYPYGTLRRLLPPGTPTPSPEALVALDEKVYADFHPRPHPDRSLNPWGFELFRWYAMRWGEVGKRCGDDEACRQQARAMARKWAR